MKDLTERKVVYLDDAIDAINEYFAMIGKLKRGGLTIEEKAIHLDTVDAIKSLPPAQQWIPCSERLPEVGTYVLISKKALSFRSNLPSVCTAHRSCDPRSGKEEWNDMLFGKLDDDDVFAWMPLPEPFKAEGRTDV